MTERVDINSLADLLSLIREQRMLVASNVYWGSIGHMTTELDFLLRARRYGLVPSGRQCLLALPSQPFPKAFARHYPDLLPPFALSNRIWSWAREIVQALPELAFNIGNSHLSVERPVGDAGHRPIVWQGRIEFMLSQKAYRARARRSFAMRSASADWLPLRRELSPSPGLARFLDALGSRPLALVHIKQGAINASAQATEPEVYLPALARIRDLGWQPVLVGREAMPESFRPFGVADYAGADFASPADDLALFSRSRVAVTGGSGIADVMAAFDLPLVFVDSWHIDFLCAARRSVAIPRTMRERASGRPLTMLEQIAVHRAMPDGAFYSFPHESHVPEPIDPRHVGDAFEEALALGPPGTEPPPPNALQRRFTQLDPESVFAAGRARVGATWAADFEPRFGGGR
jgi:putative glycosyltransferase (TIGR04372 family)